MFPLQYCIVNYCSTVWIVTGGCMKKKWCKWLSSSWRPMPVSADFAMHNLRNSTTKQLFFVELVPVIAHLKLVMTNCDSQQKMQNILPILKKSYYLQLYKIQSFLVFHWQMGIWFYQEKLLLALNHFQGKLIFISSCIRRGGRYYTAVRNLIDIVSH